MASELEIELVDLLLFGAPDGKNDVLDGQVLRQLWTRNALEARRIFENLSRQICAHHGFEWSERHVEGRSTFDLGRMHLSIEQTRIVLAVDVQPGAWRTFY